MTTQTKNKTLKEYLEYIERHEEIKRKDQEWINHLRSMGVIVFYNDEVKSFECAYCEDGYNLVKGYECFHCGNDEVKE